MSMKSLEIMLSASGTEAYLIGVDLIEALAKRVGVGVG